MSGGSYNYLCYAELDTLLQRDGDLRDMAYALKRRGYLDAALETESLRREVENFRKTFEARRDAISEVWRYVEWTDSGDTSEDSVAEAIGKWRADI